MPEPDPKPPVAAVQARDVPSPFGTRTDPYYWLRDDSRTDAAVLDYIKAENAYFASVSAAWAPFEEALYQEILARLKQDDSTVPYFRRGYWYSTRFETGKEHPIFVRRRLSLEADEEILLDGNALAAGHEFYQIGALTVSSDSNWLAYCDDTVGRRQFTLRFKHLPTGRIHATAIANVEDDVVWAGDNRTVLYVEKDPETLLGMYVRRHRLDADPGRGHGGEDPLVFEQTDLSFYTGLSKSKSEAYIFLHMQSTVSSEWRFARADDPHLEFKVFLPHERDHEYDLEHVGEHFIVRSNWQARNFRLMRAPIEENSARAGWVELLAHDAGVFIEEFDVFDRHAAVGVRSGGLAKILIKPWAGEAHYIASEDPAYCMAISVNPEMASEVLRYAYTSLTTPSSVYDYCVRSGEQTLRKREPVLGDFQPSNYSSEFFMIEARDGAQVPVSLVYRKGVDLARAPVLQYAYGAYGMSMDPAFSSTRLSLLDRGMVFAIAHVRGGQELGRAWYEQGRQLEKKNTFFDFIDVTHALVARGYGDARRVFAMGGSAGGLLVGAVANLAGSIYRGMVAQVPFVDIVTTMLDESIPLTSNEYDEWGDPTDERAYQYMLSYSPYDNVARQDYPAMLVTTGLFDSQVQYFEPLKWVAKLRAHKSDAHRLLLHVEMDAGHGGRSGRFQRYREIAREYAFILEEAGISS
jgi:oligopeptidase B